MFSSGNGAPAPSRRKEHGRDPFAENDFSNSLSSLSLSKLNREFLVHDR